MGPDEETLKKLFNLCDPEESLAPDDERSVDIDQHEVRGERWVSRMATQLERSNKPLMLFFSGLRGSGKSTELRRLGQRLKQGKANLLPVIVEAGDMLDLSNSIDIPDVLLMMLYKTERKLLELEGADPESAMKANAFQRFWAYVTRTDVEATKLEVGPQWLGGKLSFEMRANPTLRHRVRELVGKHLNAFIKEVATEFNAFEQRAKALGRKGLVVIVDSLEKLQGTSQTWQNVLNSAEKIFANDAPFLRLPVHVIYTFPPALTRRLASQVYYLPMIKLHDREGRDHGPGFDAANDLIFKRVPRAALADIFGEAALEARLREIVDWSGGFPRELVRVLRAVLSEDVYPLSEQALQRILRLEAHGWGQNPHKISTEARIVERVSNQGNAWPGRGLGKGRSRVSPSTRMGAGGACFQALQAARARIRASQPELAGF